MQTKKLITACITLALAGCGGGGGGSAASVNPNFLDSGLSNANLAEVREEFGKIRESVPKEGSVTQSTNTGTTDNVTEDEVNITVRGNGSAPTFRLVYNDGIGGTDVDVEINPNIAGVEYDIDSLNGVTLQKAILGGSSGVNFDPNGDGVVDGRVYMDIYTDYEGDGDTDYVSGGIWLFIPNNYSADNPYTIGAFVDGTMEFDALSGVSGTANYAGRTAGVYTAITDSETEVNRLLSDVDLTADFDSNTISGELTDIIARSGPGVPYVEYDGSINLGSASFSNTSGFFTGDLSGTVDGVNLSGNWGGQFYGVPSSAPPSVVAGTAGGGGTDTNTNTEYNFVSAFGAFRE